VDGIALLAWAVVVKGYDPMFAFARQMVANLLWRCPRHACLWVSVLCALSIGGMAHVSALCENSLLFAVILGEKFGAIRWVTHRLSHRRRRDDHAPGVNRLKFRCETVPVGFALVGMGRAQDGGFIKGTSDELERNRQAVVCKSAGDAGRGQPQIVEAPGAMSCRGDEVRKSIFIGVEVSFLNGRNRHGH
jgi:hypothetical protein